MSPLTRGKVDPLRAMHPPIERPVRAAAAVGRPVKDVAVVACVMVVHVVNVVQGNPTRVLLGTGWAQGLLVDGVRTARRTGPGPVCEVRRAEHASDRRVAEVRRDTPQGQKEAHGEKHAKDQE
jgi:hypothetical protein